MATQQSLLIFHPYNNEPPVSEYAYLSVRNSRPVLVFGGGRDASVVFSGILPNRYAGNGITVYIHYAMVTDVSGNIKWDVEIERVGDSVLDIDGDSFASAQTVTEAVPGTAGHIGVAAITFSDGAQMDALVAGESFRIRITHNDGSDGANTTSGDTHLLQVEIREQ